MIGFEIKNGLPFVKITLANKERALELDNVLLDTGSASTVIPAEVAAQLGLDTLPDDKINKD